MTTNSNSLLAKIKEAAKALNIKAGRESISGKAKSLTARVLTDWSAVSTPAGGAFGLESFVGVVPTRNQHFDINTQGDVQILVQGLKDMGMSERHIVPTAEAVMRTFDNSYDAQSILRNSHEISGNQVSLSTLVGGAAATSMAAIDNGIALEAFGDDINRLATDDRLTMNLLIMRPWDNIMDKGLARVNDNSPVITIRVPAPKVYDWAATVKPGATASDRHKNTRLRDLFRDPSSVNSAPKKIVAVAANDSKGVLWNNTVTYYKTNQDVSLLDLAIDSAKFGYGQADRTDLVADGGKVDEVIVAVRDPNSGSPVTEYFSLKTAELDMSRFTLSPQNRTSGQRQVLLPASLPITSATKQYNGSDSTIAAKLTDARMVIKLRVNSTVDLITGMLQASGSTSKELHPLTPGGAAPGNTTQTLFGNLTTELVAYSTDLAYDEENQRKANLAIWSDYYERQFIVPRSRIYLTEYSLTQDADDNIVAATSSAMALGNGRRGLDTIVDSLNAVTSQLKFAAAFPDIAAVNVLDESSFAAELVKPTVITTTLDFDAEELNTMNESTRLSEIHGRFRARILLMAAQLFAKSLMLNQYKGGETPVLKLWVHSTIADLVIGILDYHPELQDKAQLATGADYSMVLPNGYRLDVIKSNFDCLQKRIYAVPVIESDMASLISAASIRDCGTVSTNYVPTNGGSVLRRVATTNREIVMMSNKVGICMVVTGLEAVLGTSQYEPVLLAPNFTESMAA